MQTAYAARCLSVFGGRCVPRSRSTAPPICARRQSCRRFTAGTVVMGFDLDARFNIDQGKMERLIAKKGLD